MRSFLKETLALEGYEAHTASDGPEAVRVLGQHPQGMIMFVEPLLLRTELGEGLRDFLRSRGPQDRHVLMLLSGQLNLEMAMQALRADGHLPIPLDVDQFVAVLEDAQLHLAIQAGPAMQS